MCPPIIHLSIPPRHSSLRHPIARQLERAILLAGGISEQNFGHFEKVNWSRTARTDRGVHAISQTVALKLKLPNVDVDHQEAFRTNLVTFLPKDITCHRVLRVTGSFHAKNFCSGRTYQYLFPTYLLQSVAALEARPEMVALAASCNSNVAGGRDYDAISRDVLEGDALSRRNDSCAELALALRNYRVDAKTLERFRGALASFVGTKRYHNFTRRVDGASSQAERYITSFSCTDPTVETQGDFLDGLEWTCVTVNGQSFLLNQIRKMIASSIEVGRGRCTLEDLHKCFDITQDANLPRMPGLGLYMNDCSFELYNIKTADAHKNAMKAFEARTNKGKGDHKCPERPPVLAWSHDPTAAERMQKYRETHVWPHIRKTESDTHHFILYHAFSRALELLDVPRTHVASTKKTAVAMAETDDSDGDEEVNATSSVSHDGVAQSEEGGMCD